MKVLKKHILFLYLLFLFAGTLFFIPAIFVNQFTIAPMLWLQTGISVGIVSFIYLKRKRLFLPSLKFITLSLALAFYYGWREKWHLEAVITIVLFYSMFLLFFNLFTNKENRYIFFKLCVILAVVLCIWCAGQIIGLIPNHYITSRITGPFDNPAGVSVTLSLLLPFALYEIDKRNNWIRILYIVISIAIVSFIVWSESRAAIIAATVVIFAFITRWVKVWTRTNFYSVYYPIMIVISIILFIGLYFIKKDSANGRILIWKCTVQLIAKKPLIGFGGNGFTANYMNQQALYFTKDPDSRFTLLADNVRHPFNEYLKSILEYGIVGLIFAVMVLLYPLYQTRKNKSNKLFAVRLSLLTIAICAMFSYPLIYPFVRLMSVVLFVLLFTCDDMNRMAIKNGYLVRVIALLISFWLLSTAVFRTINELEWNRIAHKSLRGDTSVTSQMLPIYKSLHKHMKYNDMFLYNYAAELNIMGHYYESLQIARECNNIMADYDLLMLMAENCKELLQYTDAENHLKKAAAMCPVKFMPLYRLVELYLETEQTDEAIGLAQEILAKQVKVSSPVIKNIKEKMKNILNEIN